MSRSKRLGFVQKRLIVTALDFGAATADELAKWAKRNPTTLYKIASRFRKQTIGR